jgi:transposase
MGAKGETPIIQSTGARHGMSLISAVTSRGHMRFMIIDKGSVNADVFIEFLKRLVNGAEREIFLIVDRGSAHRAKKVSAFVQTLGGKLCLFFLPPYAPDRNPDELVWKHLKADTVGRMAVTSKEDFAKKVRRSMRELQNESKKSSPSFKSPRSNTPHKYALTYGRINNAKKCPVRFAKLNQIATIRATR